ncbi:MAG TPA: VWA domain-containing protein [Pyrinomonadaceae bacterium]|jgi:VWFA-related protein
MSRNKLFLLTFVLMWCGGSLFPLSAQEVDDNDTVRVRTRVVFLDALVKDKRTSTLVADLKKENFEVRTDGRERELSYFSRQGEAGRKPLALTIVLDLRRDGAGRFLRRAEVVEALASALMKLPTDDEVGVMVLGAGLNDGRRRWLVPFTRDRAKVAAALRTVPSLVVEAAENRTEDGTSVSVNIDSHGATVVKETVTEEDANSVLKENAGQPEIKFPGKDGSTTHKILARNGDVITRTVAADGKSETYVEIDRGFDLNNASEGISILTAAERPQSQAALVWLSDGIAPVPLEDRKETQETLLRTNVIFSAIVVDMKTTYKLFMPIVKPLGNWVGLSVYGSAQYLAKQTGGEVVRVRRPADYASAINKIIGNLAGRYSLGFTIAESEQDDGQMHAVEVRVRARDERGKERKLEVTTRRGYFMPKDPETQQSRK